MKCRCGKPATLRVRATGEAVCKWHKGDGMVADRIKKGESEPPPEPHHCESPSCVQFPGCIGYKDAGFANEDPEG